MHAHKCWYTNVCICVCVCMCLYTYLRMFTYTYLFIQTNISPGAEQQLVFEPSTFRIEVECFTTELTLFNNL